MTGRSTSRGKNAALIAASGGSEAKVYRTLHAPVVVVDEWNEAAIERGAVANPVSATFQRSGLYLNDRIKWLYDCCAADRSLAERVNDYRFRNCMITK